MHKLQPMTRAKAGDAAGADATIPSPSTWTERAQECSLAAESRGSRTNSALLHRRVLALLFSAAIAGSAAAADEPRRNLGELSLEELMNESVTSVSKKPQRLGDVASAVSVLTNEDIQRSAAASIPEALRLVPGLDVGSANGREWAISSRGFNNVYANKLLVLVDGRTVYSPLFAGVYWDMQQMMLEDVDRIEVIRGPGGTIWGANAVNGVINVATRSAQDTQGSLLTAETDGTSTSFGGRFGGKAGANIYYRVFADTVNTEDSDLPSGLSAGDGWRGRHGGTRVDYVPTADTHLTWQAEVTDARQRDGTPLASNLNTLGRWRREFSPDSSLQLQAYFDQAHRAPGTQIGTTAKTSDISLQHTLPLGTRHEVIWGADYRHIDMRLDASNAEAIVRDHDFSEQLFGAFVQDEITLLPRSLSLILGTKLEHNDRTGFELQPAVRTVFKPTEHQRWWAAVSRTVRTPDMIEGRDAVAVIYGAPFPGPGGTYLPALVGNPKITSEEQWAYEVGYRAQISPRLSFDLTAFYNRYRNLISFDGVRAFLPGSPVGLAEIPWANNLHGQAHGAEAVVSLMPYDNWRLTATYSVLSSHYTGPLSADPVGAEKTSPRHQAGLRSAYDFSPSLKFDTQFRYVGALRDVPAYTTADVRIAWSINRRVELALIGENLLDSGHLEQAPLAYSIHAEVERTFTAKVTCRF